MEKITVDRDKILDMIVANAGMHQFGTGGNIGRVVFNKRSVDYVYPSPGTEYLNAYDVHPEEFINMDEVEKDYPLDLEEYRTTSKDVVASETERDIDEFTEDDWNKVSEYEQEAIDEWKARASGELKEIVQVEDSEGVVIAEFELEWI